MWIQFWYSDKLSRAVKPVKHSAPHTPFCQFVHLCHFATIYRPFCLQYFLHSSGDGFPILPVLKEVNLFYWLIQISLEKKPFLVNGEIGMWIKGWSHGVLDNESWNFAKSWNCWNYCWFFKLKIITYFPKVDCQIFKAGDIKLHY